MANGKERRQYERLSKIIGIEYLTDNNEKQYSMTLDISLSGVAFLTKESLHIGNTFEISLLREEHKDPIVLPGKVVRCVVQSPGCIIAGEFNPLSDQQKLTLLNFIEEYKN